MNPELDEIYRGLPGGEDADPGDRADVDALCGSGASTYGEITAAGASRLIAWLALRQDDEFVDLGSGTGRLVVQCALESSVGRSWGIESSGFRHDVATRALAALSRLDEAIGARCRFIHGDFRECLPDTASIVYAGSLCFPSETMRGIVKLSQSRPRIRRICTLKPLPTARGELVELGGVDLDMTWSSKNRVHVYGRSDDRRLS